MRRASVRIAPLLALALAGPATVAQHEHGGADAQQEQAGADAQQEHAGADAQQEHAGAGQQRAGAGQGHAGAAAPLYTEQDLLFLRHMIVHHQQALDMAALVPARTQRAELARFARYIAGAQAAEIEVMQSLLDLAAQRGLDVPQHGPHGDPPMQGMLSSARMEALAAAGGPAFERLWLEGMIYHHQGAIDMAQAQQRQQLEQGRRPFGLEVLVEDMIVEQRAEIARMRAWLAEWGI